MKKTKKQLNDLLVDLFNQILVLEEINLKEKGIKLSITEVHVLDAIDKTDNNSMSGVSSKLMITQGTLTVSTNRLIKLGYVEKIQDSKDKRMYRLNLTEKGKEVVRMHDEFHATMIDAAMEDLHLENDQILLKSLANISDFFKDMYRIKEK